jgi:hypothetical protein
MPVGLPSAVKAKTDPDVEAVRDSEQDRFDREPQHLPAEAAGAGLRVAPR